MKFGVIGFGNIAHKFVKSIESTTDGEIYAIGSKSVKKDDPYLLSHPQVKVFGDYDEMLLDENVEAVYIAVPHKFHKQWVIKALRAHVAVLCEKPAVLSKKDMEEIAKVAREEKVYFLEALKTRMNDGYEALKEDLKKIGKINYIYANFCSDLKAYRGAPVFLFDKEQGGALNDVGPYVIGFSKDLVKSEIIGIESEIVRYDGIEEHFKATFKYANSCIVEVEGAIDEAKERYAIIKGNLGAIYVPMFNRIIDYKVELTNGEKFERHYPIKGDDMTKQIQYLIDDVKAGRLECPKHTLDDSIEVISLMNDIRKNAVIK